MAFSHHLARGAKVCTANLRDGRKEKILLIITTAQLNPDHKKYKEENIRRLSEAAVDYLEQTNEADGFMLANRLKDWETE